MNKRQFVDALAERLGSDKFSSATALDAILDEIYEAVVNGEKVTFHGFGSFEARWFRDNPDVGIPAFRAGDEFKAIVSASKPIKPIKPIKNGRQTSTRKDRPLPPPRLPTKIFTEAAEREIRDIEGKLVKDYEAWHGGKLVIRDFPIESSGERIRCDLFDASRNEIVEAKASASRWYVRMALGQLLDYRRHEPSCPSIAMLLPELPNKDLQDLLAEHGVTIIHRAGDGFVRRDAPTVT